ncbi:MAG: two-component regulator propeller domain-containing protein [Vicinamibacterales bacterium]
MSWLLAAVLLAGAPPPPVPPGEPAGYSIDVWEVDDGLPQNSVISMIQTGDGYLWLGTWAGLVRFDGVRFTPTATDLTNTHILALAEAPDGAVWIGTGGGGLARWQHGAMQLFTTADGLINDNATSLLFDHDGRLWVGTLDGLAVVEQGRIRTLEPAAGAWPSRQIAGLALHPDGRVLVATMRGLCAVTRLELVCAPGPTRLPGPISGIAVDDTNRILVSISEHGVAEWADGELRPGPCDDPICHGAGDARTVASFGGRTYVGFSPGVAVIANGHATPVTGLPNNGVRALLADAEGSLWIGTDGGGIARRRPTRVITYGTEAGLPGPVTTSIVQDTSGRIWAGTRCGPVTMLGATNRFELPATPYGLSCAVSVLAASDGALWIGGSPGGIVREGDGRLTRIGHDDGLARDDVRVLYEDRAGAIWIATEPNGVYRWANSRLEPFDRSDGIEAGLVTAFAETPDGRLFVASNAYGLYVFDGTRFSRVGDDGTLPTQLISSLIVDSRGDLWIGTANRGLYRMRAGRFEHFGVAQGLPDPVVALMLEDDDANLWVATSRGISRLLRERIEAVASGAAVSMDPIVLGKADGLRSLEGSGGGFDPSGLKDRDGRLWFSTLGGIAVVDPRRLRLNTVPPPVVVEHAILDETDTVQATAGGIPVPAGTQSLEIAYTAFSLLAPERVRFRYRLLGFDKDWHEAGSRRAVFYTNLPPAEYRFEVLAANNDGVWSPEPATLSFVVLPYWWQRRAVQLAALALLLLATGGGVRTIVLRRARARVAELERQQALDRERSRIARDLHDDIGARLTHLALLADEADDAGAGTARARLADTARETARAMDELVWSVNAAHDTVESLATYAIRFAESHARAAGLRCRFDAPARLDGVELPADVRRHLFLAFKEAVNNAVKHAGASELRVGFALAGGRLTVEVADNGRGLPAAGAERGGNGLTNIRARMEAAGGEVAFLSPAGGGTAVRFTLPVPA